MTSKSHRKVDPDQGPPAGSDGHTLGVRDQHGLTIVKLEEVLGIGAPNAGPKMVEVLICLGNTMQKDENYGL